MPGTPDAAKYDAFISYRHLAFDKRVAVRLQRLLEGFVPPKSVVPRADFKRFRVFRDETELATSNSLTDSIREALRHTRYLIVVCSPGTAASRWCMEEIDYFKELHGGSTANIRVIVIEGDPVAIMPPQLLTEQRTVISGDGVSRTEDVPVEPLALNIVAASEGKSLKKLKTEYIRIAATLLGHDFEDLYQRNHRRKTRRVALLSAGVGAVLVGVIVYGSVLLVYANRQRQLAEDNLDLAVQQQALAEENLEQAKSLMAAGALERAVGLAGEGARARAAALLAATYPSLDPEWDNYAESETKFRDAALEALYYDAYSVYAALDMGEEVLNTALAEGDTFALVTTPSRLCRVSVASGHIDAEYPVPEGRVFSASALSGTTAYAALQDGGLLVLDVMTGESTLLESVTPAAAEQVALPPGGKTVNLLSAVLRGADNIEDIHLTVLPLEGDGAVPLASRSQTFTLESDVRGDISCRYSFSENGRFLAAKHNITITVEDGTRLYDLPNKDVQVLDTALFNPDNTAAQNREDMLRTVDCLFDLPDIYVTARYHIDNNGLLFLDLQTTLYDGTEQLGYLVGTSTEDKSRSQLIIVYDVLNAAVLLQRDLLGENGDVFYSTFVPTADSLYFLPYLHKDEETGLTRFTAYSLLEEVDDKLTYSYELPDHSYHSRTRAVALPRQYAEWTPNYILSVDGLTGGSHAFALFGGAKAEITGGAGRLLSAGTGGAGDVYLAGYQGGTVHLHTLAPSHNFSTDDTIGTVHVYVEEIWHGNENTGIPIEGTGSEGRMRLVAYNTDRTRILGYYSPYSAIEDGEPGYCIWSTETGALLQRLVLPFDNYTGTDLYADLQISPDFSRVMVRRTSYQPRFIARYYFLDTATGDILGEYTTTREYNYFGQGRTEDELWMLSAATGVVETVDTTTGAVQKRETLRGVTVRELSDRIFYNPHLDTIIINDSVYSFTSERIVFSFGTIRSADPDCTAVYLEKTGARISLLPQDLYKALLALPGLPDIFGEDAAATGFNIFGS